MSVVSATVFLLHVQGVSRLAYKDPDYVRITADCNTVCCILNEYQLSIMFVVTLYDLYTGMCLQLEESLGRALSERNQNVDQYNQIISSLQHDQQQVCVQSSLLY